MCHTSAWPAAMSLKKASRKKSLSLSDDFPGRLSPVGIAPHQPPRHVAAAPVAAAGPNAAAAASSPNSGLTASRFGGLRSRRVEDTAKIFKYIDDNVIGKGVAFLGPFGRRKGECCSVLFVPNRSRPTPPPPSPPHVTHKSDTRPTYGKQTNALCVLCTIVVEYSHSVCLSLSVSPTCTHVILNNSYNKHVCKSFRNKVSRDLKTTKLVGLGWCERAIGAWWCVS